MQLTYELRRRMAQQKEDVILQHLSNEAKIPDANPNHTRYVMHRR